MFKLFNIENFRGFQNLKLEDLSRVVLVGGKNNVGKTSLLEAFFIHSGCTNAELVVRTNLWRGILPTMLEPSSLVRNIIGPSFYNYDITKPIVLSSVDDIGKERRSEIIASQPWETDLTSILSTSEKQEQPPPAGITLNLGKIIYTSGHEVKEHQLLISQRGPAEMSFKIEPPAGRIEFPGHFIHEGIGQSSHEDAARFSELRQAGKDDLILEALHALEPSLSNIEVLAPSGGPLIWVQIDKGKRMPLPLLGDGAVRLVKILLTIAICPDGIVMIDEFAYGFHYSVINSIWKVILKAAKVFNTQVIATTHSFEIVLAAHQAFMEEKEIESFTYLRLEKEDNQIKSVVYDKEALELAIERGFEVR